MKRKKMLVLLITLLPMFQIKAETPKWLSEMTTDFSGLEVGSVQLDYDSTRIQFWDGMQNKYQYVFSCTGMNEEEKHYLAILLFAAKNGKKIDIQKTTCQTVNCNFINVKLF